MSGTNPDYFKKKSRAEKIAAHWNDLADELGEDHLKIDASILNGETENSKPKDPAKNVDVQTNYFDKPGFTI